MAYILQGHDKITGCGSKADHASHAGPPSFNEYHSFVEAVGGFALGGGWIRLRISREPVLNSALVYEDGQPFVGCDWILFIK